ncbi:MAG: hypothetical protein A2151_00975 [Candidatus Muproteobacteria bacterium RBG_16_65_34]|uniref:DUF2933 domain-containing protein n=1 Tax=Candidatus Muproteobacteria bacterium RBG_16_65_34 TaxID=1817760 RepID=A0A1F6TRB1_9PROT|nr:MAG: hypothetical protein A2151_00975 [Candidatus Muproteobacteria bacterium RBG_16_65_34]
MNHRHEEEPGSRRRSPAGLALLGFLAIAAFFLLAEHRAHALGLLPFALLLLCPLLHFFGHGHNHAGEEKKDGRP